MYARMPVLIATISALFPTVALADDHDSDRYPESLPAALEVDEDSKLAFVSEAEGVQIYDCKATSTGQAWTFRAPVADLYSRGSGLVGTHYAGPTWEWNSGGTIVGSVAARVPAPVAGAIPWLRLSVVANDGPGALSKVHTILRLDTVGGVAPSTGCDATTLGAVAEVDYEATYYFYRD